VVGNCLATVVIARWEGEFDEQQINGAARPAVRA
jgi:Na+/H+-dicarboxylate symporter